MILKGESPDFREREHLSAIWRDFLMLQAAPGSLNAERQSDQWREGMALLGASKLHLEGRAMIAAASLVKFD